MIFIAQCCFIHTPKAPKRLLQLVATSSKKLSTFAASKLTPDLQAIAPRSSSI